ncbi:amino acid transporter-like protein [Phlegmacium glaucopus]|nr:amino acid transporter-like protein [Phlegmacium glaucopus]
MDNTVLNEKAEKDSLSTSSVSKSHAAQFEEYLHFAALQRLAEETADMPADEANDRPQGKSNWLTRLSDHKGQNVNVDIHNIGTPPPPTADELERENASRALRLASWATIFYLITTDILGPFNAPYAIAQLGWVPGILLYVFMGIIATYCGIILWRLFIRLDSLRYPLRSYADIVERIFGRTARQFVTILQSLQLLIGVATITLSNGQALAQLTKGKLCFAVCIIIWTIVGLGLGQIRTLKNFGFLANASVWLNLLIIFVSMGFIAHSTPNFAAAQKSLGVSPGPVVTKAFTKLPLFTKVNGIMNMVYAYGGSMIFPEMMAEMRRPMDFWKGLAIAQMLIFAAYLTYGTFVYAFQGQFTLPLAFQGVSKFAWQSFGNIIILITGIIAAGLFGNIGIKIVYRDFIEDWFKGPRLMSPKGRMIWTVLVFAYWSISFVIASSIPQIQAITGLVAAFAIMQFTYTFPPIMRFGYDVITDAMAADQPYVVGGGSQCRVDTWRQWSRWKRGLFGGRWYFKLFNVILFLGGLVTACMGMWAAGESIKEAFKNNGAATSFGCTSPV